MLQIITESARWNRIVLPVRTVVRKWVHGDVLLFGAKPPFYITEEPTYAPARLVPGLGGALAPGRHRF